MLPIKVEFQYTKLNCVDIPVKEAKKMETNAKYNRNKNLFSLVVYLEIPVPISGQELPFKGFFPTLR